MAQTFTSTDVTSGTNVFGDNQSQRVNENTLRSNFSGSSQPSDPVVGQHWYDTGNNREMTYNGTSWVAVDTNTTTQVDVKNSAGNLSNLKSFLSVAHNDDGTLKVTPTSSIDEFKENSIVVTYVNPTTFTAPNDLTGIFTQYRKVKVYLSASTAISSVSSSSYDGTSNVTTVVLSTSAMDATLTNIRYSIVQYGTPDGGTFIGDITANQYYANGWFRNYGDTGWYNETHGGGWYMTDDQWVRSSQDKGVYTGGQMKADGGFYGALYGTADVSNGINIVAGNEIKLRGSSSYNGSVFFGYDAPATINEYKFGDGTRTGSYANLVANEFHANGWFRNYGDTGWYNETHGGGWYMTDDQWVRSSQDKGVYTGGQMKADGGFYGNLVGTLGGYTAAQLIGEYSHATNGYHKFPDGTIIQWGSATLTGQNNTISFPTAFPTACSVVHTSLSYDNDWTANYATSITTTNFNFFKHPTDAYTCSWQAIGY